MGDNLGYLIGGRFGYSMLLQYGHLVRIDAKRIKLGQYLFARRRGEIFLRTTQWRGDIVRHADYPKWGRGYVIRAKRAPGFVVWQN